MPSDLLGLQWWEGGNRARLSRMPPPECPPARAAAQRSARRAGRNVARRPRSQPTGLDGASSRHGRGKRGAGDPSTSLLLITPPSLLTDLIRGGLLVRFPVDESHSQGVGHSVPGISPTVSDLCSSLLVRGTPHRPPRKQTNLPLLLETARRGTSSRANVLVAPSLSPGAATQGTRAPSGARHTDHGTGNSDPRLRLHASVRQPLPPTVPRALLRSSGPWRASDATCLGDRGPACHVGRFGTRQQVRSGQPRCHASNSMLPERETWSKTKS